ncbi:MAG: SMP-30/gluconolactonase/LRE family protein [Myxococcota bacterium]
MDPDGSSSGETPVESIEQIPILGEGLFPEGIGLDTQTGDLYVGSAIGGSIQRIVDGRAEWWKTPEDGDGLRPSTVGVMVDSEGRRLIACNNLVDFETFEFIETAVVVYDLETAELLADVPLPEVAPSHLCNDLTLDSAGTIYASDSTANMLWRIDDAYQISPVTEPGTFTSTDPMLGSNGLATSPSGRYVFITQTVDPHLYRLDLQTDEITEVQLRGLEYPGGDGIVFADDDTLLSLQNWVPHDIIAVTFDDEEYASGIVSSALEDPEVDAALSRPTTAVVWEDRMYVVNSQFEIDPPILPFWVTSIPLSRLALD